MDLQFKTGCLRTSGMSNFPSFCSIIELWPKRVDCASELGKGCSEFMVSKWWQRKSIPNTWWSALLRTKTARDAGLTADNLAELAELAALSRRKSRRRSSRRRELIEAR